MLHVLIFVCCIEARTVLVGIQVVMTDYHSAGVTPVQLFEQPSHGLPLCLGTRVGGLTADVQTTLVAYAYRVFVVVLAVGAYHPFRSPWLYRSVTTDHVVVADTELEASLAMPRIYLSCRTGLVGAYRTAVNNNQCNRSHSVFFKDNLDNM